MAVHAKKIRGLPVRTAVELIRCNQRELEDTGWVQVFGHFANSRLPIRDVRRETEPHIEVGATNYVKRSARTNYRSFCHSPSRYLFLTTTCKNCAAGKGRFLGKRFVVGYIQRIMCVARQNHWSVFGKVWIVPFDARLELGVLGLSARRQRFDKTETRRLVRLLQARPNIRDECVKEMLRVEELERAQGHAVVADKVCMDKKGECILADKCRRKKLAGTIGVVPARRRPATRRQERQRSGGPLTPKRS
jgi:hypothetical protein